MIPPFATVPSNSRVGCVGGRAVGESVGTGVGAAVRNSELVLIIFPLHLLTGASPSSAWHLYVLSQSPSFWHFAFLPGDTHNRFADSTAVGVGSSTVQAAVVTQIRLVGAEVGAAPATVGGAVGLAVGAGVGVKVDVAVGMSVPPGGCINKASALPTADTCNTEVAFALSPLRVYILSISANTRHLG
jgi:hypothetical protein